MVDNDNSKFFEITNAIHMLGRLFLAWGGISSTLYNRGASPHHPGSFPRQHHIH